MSKTSDLRMLLIFLLATLTVARKQWLAVTTVTQGTKATCHTTPTCKRTWEMLTLTLPSLDGKGGTLQNKGWQRCINLSRNTITENQHTEEGREAPCFGSLDATTAYSTSGDSREMAKHFFFSLSFTWHISGLKQCHINLQGCVILTHFEGSIIQAVDWENQHPTQAEIDSLLQNCVGGCLPSPAACSFPLCHHINTENLQDAMERRLPARPPVCSWPPILWTDGLRQNSYRIPALTLQMCQFCLLLPQEKTSVSPDRAFWRVNYYIYLLMGALNFDINTGPS